MKSYKVTYQVERWYGWKTEVFYTEAVDKTALLSGFGSEYRNIRIEEVKWYQEATLVGKG